ncbi:MAG: hypothetical protein DI604_29885 [Delftia acidovorans]|nr:MAG: hypothetical protein DI604_29885 [Delftia acidovorans]
MATIQGVYVALFGRPADPTGLAYFNSITNNGANLSNISNLSGTAEYQARFAGQNNVQIVTAIYQSLFGRAPESAGLNFFVDALNKGTLNINNVAINILDGAQGNDKTIVTNKIAAADLFTKSLDTPVEVGSYVGTAAAAQGRTFLTGVTTTVPSQAAVDASIAAIVATPPGSTGTPGLTIALTASDDTISASQANPASKSTAGDDTINGTLSFKASDGATAVVDVQTLNSGDNINADAGTDTLVLKAAGVAGTTAGAAQAASATIQPTITNVEKIFVTSVGGAGEGTATANKGGNVALTLNLDKSSGYTELWSDASAKGADAAVGAGGTAAGGTSTVTFSNIATGVVLGLKGSNDTVEFGYKTTTGTSDSATINLSAASVASLKVGGIENLTFAVSGNSTVTSLSDAQAEKIVVTGTGNLNLSTDTGATAVKSFDASALSGTLTVDVSAAANGVTVTGTKFADNITLNNGGVTTDKDVIVYNAANVSTAAAADTITNFASGEDKIDIKAFGVAAATTVNPLTAAPTAGAQITTVAKFYDSTANVTTVYVDTNKTVAGYDANDLVIKLAGDIPLQASDFIYA